MFFYFLLSTVFVSANESSYEQNDCRYIAFQNCFIENYQSNTSENIGFNFENSKCLRPEFLETNRKNISVANQQQNVFPSQNCSKVELAKEVSEFRLGNTISENDFSSQKSYIRLDRVDCVGKMERVAAEEGVEAVKYTFTKSAGKHLTEFVKHGENAGQLARFYMKSPLTIQEIMSTGKGVSDAFYKGGMNWNVPGVFRGT